MSRLLLALLLLVVVATPVTAAEGETGAVGSVVDELLARLGSPADPKVVKELMMLRDLRSDVPAARRAVDALAGEGYAAAEGLAGFVGHRSVEVREAALRALGSMGIRSPRIAAAVRDRLRDGKPGVREAALAALGRVGDAADVPALLDRLQDEDESVRATAHVALRTLTGLNLPAVHAQWNYWWAEGSSRLLLRVEASLRTIADGSPQVDVEEARLFLSSSAWVDVANVRDRCRRFLRSADPRLRAEGHLLAAAVRLGDVAEEVLSVLRYERDVMARSVGLAAAAKLGCRTEHVEALQPQVAEAPVVAGSP